MNTNTTHLKLINKIGSALKAFSISQIVISGSFLLLSLGMVYLNANVVMNFSNESNNIYALVISTSLTLSLVWLSTTRLETCLSGRRLGKILTSDSDIQEIINNIKESQINSSESYKAIKKDFQKMIENKPKPSLSSVKAFCKTFMLHLETFDNEKEKFESLQEIIEDVKSSSSMVTDIFLPIVSSIFFLSVLSYAFT